MNEIEYLLSQIASEINEVQQTLSAGAAKDFSEYQHLCGKIRGLLVAEDIIKALQERIDKNDE